MTTPSKPPPNNAHLKPSPPFPTLEVAATQNVPLEAILRPLREILEDPSLQAPRKVYLAECFIRSMEAIDGHRSEA
jgi:hypothetical protein